MFGNDNGIIMNDFGKDIVTICIVNYKTEELTRLCLRSIRKYTTYPYKIIVVDNNSADSSLEYLRSVPYIKLIERPGINMSGSMAHGTALDIGLNECDTEYFLAMHTDTFIRQVGWLSWLVEQINKKPNTACTGSGKLDLKSNWQVQFKKLTDYKLWIKKYKSSDPRKYQFYIRAICALYRTYTLKKEDLKFAMDVENGMTCAKELYFQLLSRGYNANVISDFELGKYIYHLAHATMVINPEFKIEGRSQKKYKLKLEEIFSSPEIQSVMNDSSLDI